MRLLWVWLAAGLSGCSGGVVEDGSAPAGSAVGRAMVYVEEARASVGRALPVAGPAARPDLERAGGQLASAGGELERAAALLEQVRFERAELERRSAAQQATIDAYRGRWFGDRFFRVLRWLVLAAAVGSALIGFGLMGGGAVHTVAAYAGRSILSVLNPLAAVTWLADHVWLRRHAAGSRRLAEQ